MMEKPVKAIKLLFALSSFIAIFYSVLELTYFLSFPKDRNVNVTKGDPWLEAPRALLTNMILLSLFILQHSAMASKRFKEILKNAGLGDLERTIYVSATATVLSTLVIHWQTTQVTLWNLDLSFRPIYFLYIGVHATAWVIIYVANVCTDVTELVGLKQIYYSLRNLPDPIHRKSIELRKLTSHMRHPSFLGFFLILWFYPIMSLDRLLLASILTAYMYISWNTDGQDYNYQKYMYQRKYHELRRLASH